MFNIESATKNLQLSKIIIFLSTFKAYEGVTAVFLASITGSYALATTVMAVSSLSQSFFEVPTGIFSDKIGRKRTILLGHLFRIIGLSIYFVSTNFSMLIAGALLMGLSVAFNSGTVTAFTKECCDKTDKNFSKVQGMLSALGRYSLFISGAVGAALIYFFGLKYAILITLIFRVFAFILSFLLTDTDTKENVDKNMFKHTIDSFRDIISNKKLLNLSLGKVISYSGGGAEFRSRSLYFELMQIPAWIINLLGIFNNILSGVFMQFSHRITKFLGSNITLTTGEIISRGLNFMFIIFYTPLTPVLMQANTAAAYGVNDIATENLLQDNINPKQRATMSSMISLVGSLLYSILIILIGFSADFFGLIPTLALTQILLMSSAFFYHRSTKV